MNAQARDIPALIGRGAVTLAILIGFALPFLVSDYDLYNLSRIVTVAMCVASLNLVLGFTGQVSLGHGAVFGIGGYATLMSMRDLGVSPVVGILVGVLVSAVVGLVIGIPAVRLGGFNLGLFTIVIAAVFPIALFRFSEVTGGQSGIVAMGAFSSPSDGLTEAQWMFLVVFAILIAVLFLLQRLVSGRAGGALAAIRSGQILAASSGIDVHRVKLQFFVVSAAVAGLAGGLYGLVLGLVVPDSYPLLFSITLLVAAVVGGTRSWIGAIIGGALVVYLPTMTSGFIAGQASGHLADLIFAIILALCVLFAPNGLVGSVVAFVRRMTARRPTRHTAPDEKEIS
ncbi:MULTISPECIES: branched-chain amino acid ABC transporter permease [unclassified Microbacterium]|uniref:branched-chain amino acid ABC transporter permease n=1 Tax=unclassified Microbacterium TaxID=2609290 RepID=UPI00097EB346|nr:branched-chain amino acid ABC transporter permease [Microbacterium sp. JB110]RCS57266.1 branched-chain amino acid ABC transporter permease [Microbacterium sp. JB110]SJM58801.1 Branched-chain amino acid transport system permease protein LivM (TC 3.A.1.4.1) [Frigoribacterium sp. JB110]